MCSSNSCLQRRWPPRFCQGCDERCFQCGREQSFRQGEGALLCFRQPGHPPQLSRHDYDFPEEPPCSGALPSSLKLLHSFNTHDACPHHDFTHRLRRWRFLWNQSMTIPAKYLMIQAIMMELKSWPPNRHSQVLIATDIDHNHLIIYPCNECQTGRKSHGGVSIACEPFYAN